ncbi:MAG TPA: FecR domain-containing protein [Rhodocyclaceae bacterium]|nr:FecR domain-containing protein [Rhodocyclaceae bacterium]
MANRLPRISAASLLACLLFWAAQAFAGGAGVVTHLSGTLSVKRADGTTKLLAVKSEVFPGDVLTTEQETYARVKFVDGGEIVLRPASQMKLDAYAFSENQSGSDNAVMSLLKGGFRAVTGLIGKRNHDNVHYSTPTATIGIRGTHFGALYCNNDCGGIPTTSGQAPANGLHVDVATGAVLISNGAGAVQINMGQFAFVAGPNAPPVIVPPQQGIQVTMPTNISQNKGTGQGIGKSNSAECNL